MTDSADMAEQAGSTGASDLPPPRAGSMRAVLGEQRWLEHERRRTAQYGFCEHGHHRSARVVRCTCCHTYQRTQLFCGTCEHG